MEKIKIGNYFITFRRKKGLKSIRLRLDKNGEFILTTPYLCLKSTALNFAKNNIEWMTKQQNNYVPQKQFKNGDCIILLGNSCTITHNPAHKSGVQLIENTLIVGGEVEFIHRRITDFAKKQLYNYIQNKAIQMADTLGTKPRKITLRNTSSRWGSCSSLKDLNFCWKLAFAPLFVIDYIVAHEVSHLIEMNHGENFWKTVAKLNVEQAEAQIWLRKNGKDLQAIL